MTVDIEKARTMLDHWESYAEAPWRYSSTTALMARETRDTIAALLDEREEDQKVIAVWRGRTQRAEEERDALARDAARYRFMRRFDRFAYVDSLLDTTYYNSVDAAVDEAMKGASYE